MSALLVQQADRIFAASVNPVDVVKITHGAIYRALLEGLVPWLLREEKSVMDVLNCHNVFV